MNMHGFIEADDGGTIMVNHRGYGRVHGDSDAKGRRRVVGTAWQFADTGRHRWLNESIWAVSGEVRVPSIPPVKMAQADVRLVCDVAEI